MRKRRRRFYYFSLALLFLAFLGLGAYWVFAAISVPDFKSLEERKIIESTKIYDRTGEVLLYDVHSDIKRTVIPFETVPRHLKNATVAIEDVDFYNHHGISIAGIIRAFFVNIISGEIIQGGSTITQQLVKNTFLTVDRTYTRKIKELILALKVESRYSKDEILNLYLNEVPYGGANYGVEAASQSYFGKPAEKLSLAESAYIAAMAKAPTRYSPFGNHPEELEARKNLVLERMRELDFITEEELSSAKSEKVEFINRGLESIKAPHFSLYVREYLVEKYGEDVVESGGLRVITTLNWDWQEKAQKIVREYAEENEEKFNAWNAGLVALDPKTGDILVMVGSRDFFEEPRPEGCVPGVNCRFDPKVNITLRERQPGSSIKPVVYATAFSKGYTDKTVVFDLPTEFNPSCHPDGSPGPGVDEERCYHPQNYDEVFRGPVTLREALAQSINVPSVKTLYLSGLNSSLETARAIGISTLNDPARYGLTLVLGGGEVKLLELSGGYGAFANDGVWNPPAPILKVFDSEGRILEEKKDEGRAVIKPEIARLLSDVLSDNQARAPAFGERSFLYFPERQVAVKTGTTNDYRDAWVVGYTPNLVAGVWAGNSDNSPMEKRVAGFIAAPLWNAFLSEIFKELPLEDFKPPPPLNVSKPALKGEWRGGRTYKIDKISGKLATEFTPEETVEEKVVREVHSILYWVNKSDPDGGIPANPDSDPQFKNWEEVVRDWARARGFFDESEDVIPKEFDDVHLPGSKPTGFFISPSSEMFPAGSKILTRISVTGRFPVRQIDLFLGSQYLGSLSAPPFEFSFALEGAVGEERTLRANIYDTAGNKEVISKSITVSGN